jgi:hypothetical protein
MEMKYFWVGDKVAQDAYIIKWHHGQENLADYQSKHHLGSHHQAVCPWYLHERNSPLVLPRATRHAYAIPTYKDTCRIEERVATANSPQWQPIAIDT